MKKYKVLDDIEHVLLRPTMYIGQYEPIEIETFISKDFKALELKKINLEIFVYKMFDEILTNAIDESKRNKDLNSIRIFVENKKITIRDNGGGIDVVKFDKEKYLPEILFSKLRSSSNFYERENITGMYGVGSTLVNIFSKEFSIKVSDGKKYFEKTWYNNLSESSNPIIEESNEKFVEVSFILDDTKINYEFGEDTLFFLKRRVLDFAYQYPDIEFFFNNQPVKALGKDFSSYCKLYNNNIDIIFENSKWKICLFEPSDYIVRESFVNGNLTLNGGTHVKLLYNTILPIFSKYVDKSLIKGYFSYLILLNLKEPLYSSQDKYTLISKDLPKIYFKALDLENSKTLNYLKKLSIEKFNKKLDDDLKKIKTNKILHYFEPTSSKERILFITEGESAALAGKSVRTSNMGFYSLRGKFINVISSSDSRLKNNEEFKSLKAIIQNGNFEKVVIMTDQDYDGNSIAGLLISFFVNHFQEIVKEGKLYKTNFPLIICDKKHFFSNLEEFHKSGKSFKEIKYCKGLGSYTTNDFKIFFSDLDKYLIQLKLINSSKALVNNIFSKSKESIEWRKKWLQEQ